MKLAGGEDSPTSLVIERACALHVSVADSAMWGGHHKEYLLIRMIRPFATRITLWNGGAHHSLRLRIWQQGKIRIRVDCSMCALLCTSNGRHVWVGCLPESECPLQARTVQGSSLARSKRGRERIKEERSASWICYACGMRREAARRPLLSHSYVSSGNASRSTSSSLSVILCYLLSDSCAHAHIITPHVLYARAGLLQLIIIINIIIMNY